MKSIQSNARLTMVAAVAFPLVVSEEPSCHIEFSDIDDDRASTGCGSVNTDSLEAFLSSVEKRAWSIAHLSTRDDDAAFDIVQDAMLKMFECYADKPAAERPALFFRILNNRMTDHHRRRGFDRLVRWFGQRSELAGNCLATPEAVDQLTDDIPGPDVRADSDVIGVALRRALDDLSHRQRQVFLLRQWQGMSVAETAFALGVSEGSIKTHLSNDYRPLSSNHLLPIATWFRECTGIVWTLIRYRAGATR